MNALNLKLRYVIYCLLFISYQGYSQCNITAPAFICIGNPGIFNIQSLSGGSVQSVHWDFGDGYTSSTQNTGHLYSKPGKYKVYGRISFSSGSSCNDSIEVQVLSLPISRLLVKHSDSCYNKNKICVKDSSESGGVSQQINRRLLLWGDGRIEKIDSGTFTNCHTYVMLGKFKITLEITKIKDVKTQTAGLYPFYLLLKPDLQPMCINNAAPQEYVTQIPVIPLQTLTIDTDGSLIKIHRFINLTGTPIVFQQILIYRKKPP